MKSQTKFTLFVKKSKESLKGVIINNVGKMSV